MLQAERSGTSLLLADWYHKLSDKIYDEYFTTGAFPQCVDSLLANGKGRVQCLPQRILQAGPGLGLESSIANDTHDPDTMPMAMEPSTTSGINTASMSMDTASMPSMTTNAMSMSMRKRSEHTASPSTGTAMSDMSAMSSTMTSMMTAGSSTTPAGTEDFTMSTMSDMSQMALGPRGCSPPMMFRPGLNASSLPPETCTNTTSELFKFTADASRGWTALHLVNAGAVSRLSISLDGHSMFVYAADGLYVTLQEVQVCRRQVVTAIHVNLLVGSAHLHWPALFSDGTARPRPRRLLSKICILSLWRHAASHRRPSHFVVPCETMTQGIVMI